MKPISYGFRTITGKSEIRRLRRLFLSFTDDKPVASVEGQVTPCPAPERHDFVLEADDAHQVDEHPYVPGQKPLKP